MEFLQYFFILLAVFSVWRISSKAGKTTHTGQDVFSINYSAEHLDRLSMWRITRRMKFPGGLS